MVKMLSLVEKLEDLKVGLDNDTYINVILQSLPLLYDPFIVNFNMNRLEKSINELINMLVQYEATIKKSAPSVLIGERQEGLTLEKEEGALEEGLSQSISQSKVLQRSRKLSKDEVVLRLGDGKAVAAEAVEIIKLVTNDRVRLELKDCYFVPNMIKNIISIPLLDNPGQWETSWIQGLVCAGSLVIRKKLQADTRSDELLLEESSEAPQSNAGTSSAPTVSTDNVPILHRSAIVPQPPERYGFLGVTGQLDNDPKTYREAMSDIDLGK
ncbi:hypothetical protein Sango_2807900 [Sesamum angolense]|uniref:Retrovirus-related Pol polyprotein from transposon TNT 1-94-like beta-barrel domain-containing protein n=1 Tax=Sesamum angolense TaxID=2727404 RepID=A0AAE1T7W0_9LAMI|nr:hypothetical protein Sango_2807900 [Sesamum angolense]